jgi:hypothetical protein
MYNNLYATYENNRLYQQTRRSEAEAYHLSQMVGREQPKTAHHLKLLAALRRILVRETRSTNDAVLSGKVQQPTAS